MVVAGFQPSTVAAWKIQHFDMGGDPRISDHEFATTLLGGDVTSKSGFSVPSVGEDEGRCPSY